MKLCGPVLSLFLCACTGPQAFVTFHSIDTLQTLNMPCQEIDPITSRLISSDPSSSKVLLWSAGVLLTYYAVRQFIPESYHEIFDWSLVSIKALVVSHNTKEGCQ